MRHLPVCALNTASDSNPRRSLGTDSDLGVFRLKHDVLDDDPDLLFIEFAVNDAGRDDPRTNICFVYTLAGNMLETLKQEQLPRSMVAMEQVADHYGIPTINMGLEVARLEKARKLIFEGDLPRTDAEKTALGDRMVFSPDAVHPYPNTGHQIYLEAVVRSMETIRKFGQPGPHAMPAPFRADNWEHAKMVPLSAAKLSPGWQRLEPGKDSLAKRFGNRLPEVWKATKAGESISFRFRGTTAKVYDLLGPDGGQVIVKVGDTEPMVKPRFDAYCTYHRLATLNVAESLPDAVHQVELTIHPEQPNKAAILSQRNEKIDDPKPYDDTAWHAGAILLVGELVD
ncbi:MAG: SGNH/GDSL hydrolase family protein [Verrucomicrobiia bacterium]